MEFSELVKSTRKKRYDNAYTFINERNPGCTYAYYQRVENGTAFPKVGVALEIIAALGINQRSGLMAWARTQMPDAETKAIFSDLEEEPLRSTEQLSLDRSVVVNRMQAKLLESNPIYWEMLVYCSCHHEFQKFDEASIAKKFDMKKHEVRNILNELHEYGLIDLDEDGSVESKEWFYIPHKSEYVSLRDLNFQRAQEKFWTTPEDKRLRTTITRLVSDEQIAEIESYVEAIQNRLIDLPDVEPPKARPYTVGIFASPRNFGNA
jgi:hypothetical protein